MMLPAACGSGAQESVRDPTTIQAPAGAVAALQRIEPSGRFAVGRIEASPEGQPPVWLYYPAAASRIEPQADGPLPSPYGTGLARRFGADAAAALLAMTGHARADAPVAEGRFPLLVFSPGATMGGRDYRLFVEALASHGYVVAMTHPLGSPPAGAERYGAAAGELAALVPALRDWAKGTALGAHLAPGRIGLIGHSIGGAASVLALAQLPNGAVAVNLDGDFAGAARSAAASGPILYLIGKTDGESEASVARRLGDWKMVAGGNPDATIVQIATLRHFDFADAALLPAGLVPEAQRRNRFGPIGGERAHAATTGLVLGFLDETLRGQAGAFNAALRAVPEANRR
ncbi:hypothetical protein P6144_03565 [Sphingomonas sp. HITSZ_GF]|uniref:hypothetical protein n=1 Tax=Sphingomonas sp. HITSZ_GF TaxID=3037247 RepID=UPI00240D5B1F|nr:hypothetical protein [Sphingomonas sp. HITSZ_GF]MDG2532712.1 hypothetical protein [Sphingomonas sp. HITSZ_GF]